MLLIAAVGYTLGRTHVVQAHFLTALSVQVLIPALVFYALTTSTLPRTAFAQISGFIVLQFFVLALVVWLAARLGRWGRVRTAGVLFATQMSNAGNAGLPLAFFAWGQPGLNAAVGFFAIYAVLVALLSVYIGARAGTSSANPARALLRQPVTYAIIVGLLLNLLGVTLPSPIAKAAQILANGSISMFLLLIGLQLAEVQLGVEFREIAFATVVRLLVAPILAWVSAPVLGLEGVVRQTSILLASLPTAVSAAVWATEFGTDPALVSSVVVVTTLLSVITITGLLVLLR
ncbi:MAG TPA: AEC family transporter [bacterium]|nr:AEC family transporter [bacterium]